jgi:glycosyltransferase involved in cell wall biosynthesis
MDKPIVSVIIPTYNRYEYLLRAIESVYNQTYKNIEVIIINDGSTNKEYKELASLKSGVTVINLPKNQKEIHGFGPGNIRNFGLEKSNGKYIAFLDDDDYWLESKLEIQIDILEGDEYKISSSEAFIGEGPYNSNQNYKKFLQDFYYKDIKKIYTNSLTSRFQRFKIPDVWDEQFLRKHNLMITSSVVIEKQILDKINGFRNLPIYADWDCWRGAIQFSKSIFVKEPLVYYDYQHADGRLY